MPIFGSNRSTTTTTTIPSSFDRFRQRSMDVLFPFHSHEKKNVGKNSSKGDRSWARKIQVHPNNNQPIQSGRSAHDASHLFNATLSQHSQKKKNSSSLFDIRPTSNVIRVNNNRPLPMCPPTPCMIGYRHKSLPTLVPTRIVKYPKTYDELLKQSEIDYFDG